MANSNLLGPVVGILVVFVLAWVADINDQAGNVAAMIVAMLWLLWLMKNAGKLNSLTSSL